MKILEDFHSNQSDNRSCKCNASSVAASQKLIPQFNYTFAIIELISGRNYHKHNVFEINFISECIEVVYKLNLRMIM